ncbi:MAG: hypothetical protein U0P45_07055 [Acidimicrobiales bacterium]
MTSFSVPAATTPNWATANGSLLACANFGDPSGATVVRCNLGSIVKGGQASVVVNVTAPQVAQAIGASATVSSTTPDPSTTNNTASVSVTVKAPTGGVCKGGVCDTVPQPIAPACAVLTSVTAPVGYYSVYAAVWNDFTIQSCSTSTEALTVEVTETDVADGSVDYRVVYPISLLPSQNSSMVLDNDFAPFNTTYDIAYTVRDSSGSVLTTATTRATTPAPQ